ncbi:MAG: DUF504 domain-containing protein [Archaeoglobaceae archaeon]
MRKFRTRETLNKLKWGGYDFTKVTVVFLDRFAGFKEIEGNEIESIGHKFIYLKDGRAIPQHRVVEIRYRGEVVWRKQ